MTLAEMRRRYEGGWSSMDIAPQAGCAPQTVIRRLEKMGVEIRPRSGPHNRDRTPEPVLREAVALHREHGTSGAAEILGVHPTTVTKRVRRAGELDAEAKTNSRRVAVKRAMPPVPEGFMDLAEAGPVWGWSRSKMTSLCVAGMIPGATQESTWPRRWFVPRMEKANA